MKEKEIKLNQPNRRIIIYVLYFEKLGRYLSHHDMKSDRQNLIKTTKYAQFALRYESQKEAESAIEYMVKLMTNALLEIPKTVKFTLSECTTFSAPKSCLLYYQNYLKLHSQKERDNQMSCIEKR